MKRTKISTIKTVSGIKDPYIKRILSNIIGKDAFNIYCQTPSRLKHFVKGLSDKQLRTPPEKEKWSIVQIVNHLCDAENVFAYRVRMILSQPGCKIQAYDENAWAKNLHYEKANCLEKLELFVQLRNDHIKILRSLSKSEWKRFGIHEERGKENVERLVQMYAGHDVNHVKQVGNIRKTMLEKTRR